MEEWSSTESVCSRCFVDDHLRRVADRNADNDLVCSFCEDEQTPAAPVDAIVEHIRSCLHFHYEEAVCLPWDGEEGRYFGATYETREVLENVGLCEAIAGANTDLFDEICGGLGDQIWTDRDPFALPERRQLDYSWRKFSEFIKHHRRFFFLGSNPKYAEFDGGESLLGPNSLLKKLVQFSLGHSLITTLPQGKAVFRVRQQRPKEQFK